MTILTTNLHLQVERDMGLEGSCLAGGIHEDIGVFLAVNDSKGRALLRSLVEVSA